jgi:hypothetical protein
MKDYSDYFILFEVIIPKKTGDVNEKTMPQRIADVPFACVREAPIMPGRVQRAFNGEGKTHKRRLCALP